MILIPSQKGQLGNHLFNIAHFAANAIQHDLYVSYPCFNYPLEQFKSLGTKTPILSVKESSKKQNKSRRKFYKNVHRYFRSSPFHLSFVNHGEPHIDISEPSFVANAKKKLMICKGFGFRDPLNFEKHQNQLREIFALNDTVTSSVFQFQDQLNISESTIVIGFHIRRADYASYNSGRYFFSDDDWIHWFQEIKDVFQVQGKKVLGLLFSDEDVSHLTSNIDNFHLGSGDMYEDLEMMNRCDYLLGPPSTFSGWASFMGNVPILRLENSRQTIRKEDFSPVKS